VTIVAILLERGLSDDQIALFLTRVVPSTAHTMMQHLARSSFTVGSYTEPYQPHLFGVPESEEEALPYAAFQGPLSPPPPPSALFLRHPLGLILGT
jgi:hypothetical protein